MTYFHAPTIVIRSCTRVLKRMDQNNDIIYDPQYLMNIAGGLFWGITHKRQ